MSLKLDGTAKGGIVVAISRDLGLPIRFLGIGEQINDMVAFDAEPYDNSLFDCAVAAHAIGFMEHALALARKGAGLASPNPMVGCVIVREGQIVGEGFHQYEWRDHAEIVALKSAGGKARGATLYVTLEPCNHTGRTGPCTEAIIAAGVQRVVAAMDDPNPVNSRRGFERLRPAGIEVFTGFCEEEASRLNEPFACW